jgi:hypothetical protein
MPPWHLTDAPVRALHQRYRSTPLTLRQVAAEAGVAVSTLVGEFMRARLPRKTHADDPARPPPPSAAPPPHRRPGRCPLPAPPRGRLT